jgi:hypothetical protein
MLRFPTLGSSVAAAKDLEPANFRSCQEILSPGESLPGFWTDSREHCQVFALAFHCQSCKRIPEVFMVRREGPRLTLTGRAPQSWRTSPAKHLRAFFSSVL